MVMIAVIGQQKVTDHHDHDHTISAEGVGGLKLQAFQLSCAYYILQAPVLH